MKILLVLNKPNREIPIMESIRKEIENILPDSDVQIKEMCTYSFHNFVLNFKPDVILTFPFTCEGFSSWYYFYKFFLGCKIISFRAEGVVDFSSEFSINWATGFDKYGKRLVDFEIFWGSKLADIVGDRLLKQNKISSQERLKIFGYPRLESYFRKNNDNSALKKLPTRITSKLAKYSVSKTLFFITGFHLANYSRKDLINAKDLNAENNIDELLKGVNISKKYKDKWISEIINIAKKHKDILIVVKKHPIENKDDYKILETFDNVLYIYEDIEIQNIFPFVGLFFHYGSSCLVDTYLIRLPSVYVYMKENNNWYSDLGWPSSIKIKADDIESVVTDFLDGKIKFEMTEQIKQTLKDNFNIEIGKPYNPSKQIAELILDKEPAQRIPLSDRYLWKSLIYVLYKMFYRFCGGIVKRIMGLNPDLPFDKQIAKSKSCGITK